jgi:anti-sigma factor RsiW
MHMNVTREVILDLFPVYLSGEASPATRALVEEYLKQDPELAQRLRLQYADNFASAVPSIIPPELELRSLRRTRKLLRWQAWLLGFGIGFTLTALSFGFTIEGGRFKEFRFLLLEYPAQLGAFLALGLLCWAAYFMIRRRLRTAP